MIGRHKEYYETNRLSGGLFVSIAWRGSLALAIPVDFTALGLYTVSVHSGVAQWVPRSGTGSNESKLQRRSSVGRIAGDDSNAAQEEQWTRLVSISIFSGVAQW